MTSALHCLYLRMVSRLHYFHNTIGMFVYLAVFVIDIEKSITIEIHEIFNTDIPGMKGLL